MSETDRRVAEMHKALLDPQNGLAVRVTKLEVRADMQATWVRRALAVVAAILSALGFDKFAS